MRWRELLHLNETQPLPADFFAAPRRVHFLGVGGIGMSALALLLQARGHHVSGSDEHDGAMQQKLRDSGVQVFIGHEAANVGEAEAIFYSSAIPADNPEFAAAREKGLPLWHRSQLLAHFVNTAKHSIAVSGTHGKSTTSAMIAHILTETGANPTAILGAVYPPFESNLRIGDDDLIVVEADESDGSFTLLQPTVAVILNVEPEHLENYDESEMELWRAFKMFAEGSKRRVLCANDRQLYARLYEEDNSDLYGVELTDLPGVSATDLRMEAGRMHFMLRTREEVSCDLPVPGRHNVSNGVAAIVAAGNVQENPFRRDKEQDTSRRVGSEEMQWLWNLPETLSKPLQTFAGTLRRFERKGESHDVVVYDDYGHHPTEVRATLQAAKEFLERPITVVFQPHRYSRTQALWRDFGSAFDSADRIIITQLYSAHEEPIPGVSGRLIFDAVHEHSDGKPVFYAETLEDAKNIALQLLEPNDALLTMGAGDVTKLGPQILKELDAR